MQKNNFEGQILALFENNRMVFPGSDFELTPVVGKSRAENEIMTKTT